MHSVALEINRTISNIQPTTIDTGPMELKENAILKLESKYECGRENLLPICRWSVERRD